MNLAFVAGSNEQIAIAGERHGPNVFLVWIVEQFRLAVGAYLINLAVGIGGGVDLVFAVEHNGVDLQAIQLGEGPAFSCAIDDEDLGRTTTGATARGVKVALRIDGESPQI